MKKLLIYSILGTLITVNFNSPSLAGSNPTNTVIEITNEDTKNRKYFTAIMQKALNDRLAELAIDEIIQKVAENFLGAQYQSGLLDRSQQETLVITFDRFDCLIFVETVLAIARNIALQDNSYQSFTNNIINHRYKNANMNGYCSRLHYFSDWIESNQTLENIKNITRDLGGLSLEKKLNFMSSHRDSYAQIMNNDANYQCIIKMEADLERLTIYYIPTKDIQNIYSKLRSGDIIGVATNIPGLDVTHTGLVYRYVGGKIGLIHASPRGKVTISPDLSQYISGVPNSIGILVARPLDRRKNN